MRTSGFNDVHHECWVRGKFRKVSFICSSGQMSPVVLVRVVISSLQRRDKEICEVSLTNRMHLFFSPLTAGGFIVFGISMKSFGPFLAATCI